MVKLVLVRHGQSEWNKKNLYTGWTDVDITPQGAREAREAGRVLKKRGFTFDVAFSSYLKKSIRTLWVILDELDEMYLPVTKAWQLNERHYGALQGLNKAQTAKQYGEEQVKAWRRSFATPPPLLKKSDPRYPGKDPRYKHLKASQLPVGESLKGTLARVLPYYQKEIVPLLRKKKKVLIVAHGNSLRALIKYLDNISDEDIPELNIPTGIPLVYELDARLKPTRSYYLAEKARLKSAIGSVKKQGKARN